MSLHSRIGKPWSYDEIRQLLASIQVGKTHKEIAEEHERTTGAIAARLRALAFDYHAEGRSMDDIKKFTELSEAVIHDAIQKRQYQENKKEAITIAKHRTEKEEAMIILLDIQQKVNLLMKKLTEV